MIAEGRILCIAGAAALWMACASSSPYSGTDGPDVESATPGFYNARQASRGLDAFTRVCAECHAVSEFRGQDFEWRWRRRTAWNLYRTMTETMPEDNPGGLPAQTYVDVLAYILQLNDYAAGTAELIASEAAMEVIPLGPRALKTPTANTSNDR